MFHVTADSNVYISALHFGGVPRRFLEAARLHFVELAVSGPILDEVRRVLRDKFRWSAADVAYADERLALFLRRVDPTLTLNVITHDPPDNRVLECAVTAGSQFIVSGDDDLLRLGVYDWIRFLKVAEFLELTQLPIP